MKLFRAFKHFLHLGHHEISSMYTRDVWHKDWDGKTVITSRKLYKECSCGYVHRVW
jgi:hypothetical protein